MKIIKIRQPDRRSLEQVLCCLADGPLFPYLKDKILKECASNADDTLYVAKEKDTIEAFVLVRYLKWDSGIFGFKIGRIEHYSLDIGDPRKQRFLNRIIMDCRKERYRHLHCRIGIDDPGTLRILEKLRFCIADIQVTLCASDDIRRIKLPVSTGCIGIRKALRGDAGRFKKFIKGLFGHTRFTVDPGYPGDAVDRMYYEWLKRAISDKGRMVFVAQDKETGGLAGFSICKIDPYSNSALGIKTGTVDLIAVGEPCRNKGIGQRILRHSLIWFKDRVDKVEIRTQISNITAIRSFMKSGFREFVKGVALPAGISMHRWF